MNTKYKKREKERNPVADLRWRIRKLEVPEEGEAAEQVTEQLVRGGFGLKGEETALKALDCANKGEDFHPRPLHEEEEEEEIDNS